MNPDLLAYAALAIGALALLSLSGAGKQHGDMVANRNPLGCVMGIFYLALMIVVAAGMLYVMTVLFPAP